MKTCRTIPKSSPVATGSASYHAVTLL